MKYKVEKIIWFPNKKSVQPGFSAATVVFTTDGSVLYASYDFEKGHWEDAGGELVEWDEIDSWASIEGPE